MEALQREGEALTLAAHVGMAVNDPKLLSREQDAFARRAELTLPVEEAFDRAKRQLAAMRRQHGG